MSEYQWKDVSVVGFDELMEALERADRKGYMPDAVKEAWEGFNWKPAQQEPVACQYAQDVAMPEYRCVGRCQYDTSPPAQQQEPVAWMDRDGDLYANEPDKNWCPPHYPLYTTPPAAQPAPDLQAELEATNRQVEILSDALAESRREVAQLKSQPAPLQEPVVWMYVNKSTHETKFQKHMRDFVDHSLWSEVPLYGEPLANHELQCVCGAVWCGDEMVHLPYKHPQAQRKPLTDEEIWQLVDGTNGSVTAFARAIEAKLKEKNT